MNIKKIKKVLLILAIFAVSGILIFKYAGKEKGIKKEVNLYFFNEKKTALLVKENEFSAKNEEELIKEIAKALIKGPSGKKYSPIMDKGTKLLSADNKNGNLEMVFSEGYPRENYLTSYAIIKTFCQFPDVSAVKIVVDNIDVLGQGFVSGDEINLESDEDCAKAVSLYFANKDKTQLVKVRRKVNITDTRPIEEYVVSELIKGIDKEDYEGLLPKETGIISVETTDGVCYVNFKSGFGKGVSQSKKIQELMIYSIVNSLTEIDGVLSVQILIDGKKAEKIGVVDISKQLYRNETIIKEVK